jgi:hypothetical protein
MHSLPIFFHADELQGLGAMRSESVLSCWTLLEYLLHNIAPSARPQDGPAAGPRLVLRLLLYLLPLNSQTAQKGRQSRRSAREERRSRCSVGQRGFSAGSYNEGARGAYINCRTCLSKVRAFTQFSSNRSGVAKNVLFCPLGNHPCCQASCSSSLRSRRHSRRPMSAALP